MYMQTALVKSITK